MITLELCIKHLCTWIMDISEFELELRIPRRLWFKNPDYFMNMITHQLLSQTKAEAWPTKLLATFVKCVRDHFTSGDSLTWTIILQVSGFASSSVATPPQNYSNLNSSSLLTASFWSCEINLISNSIFSRIVEQNLNSSALWLHVMKWLEELQKSIINNFFVRNK